MVDVEHEEFIKRVEDAKANSVDINSLTGTPPYDSKEGSVHEE